MGGYSKSQSVREKGNFAVSWVYAHASQRNRMKSDCLLFFHCPSCRLKSLLDRRRLCASHIPNPILTRARMGHDNPSW